MVRWCSLPMRRSPTLAQNGIDFVSTIDGANNLTVSATSGAVTFGGFVRSNSPLSSLSVTAATINLNADDDVGNIPTVVTTGSQTYTGPVVLGANTTLESGGAVDFESTIDGPYDFNVEGTVTTGIAAPTNVTFEGEVGSASKPLVFSVIGSTTIDTDTIHVSGSQFYQGPVTLAQRPP